MPSFRFRLARGDRNVGTVYLPDPPSGPVPVLIVCFGGISDREPYPFTAELRTRLTAEGAAVVTFDFHGWGETGGEPSDWTYCRWAANLADVHQWVSAQPWADGQRIAALGISAGSTVVLRYAIDAGKLAVAISVATFLGHFVSMPDGPAKQLVDHLDTLLAGGTVEAKGRGDTVYYFGIEHLIDAIASAPIYRLHAITCPILFLQGEADSIFRRSDARLGYDLLRSHDLPAARQEIEGGDHTLGNVAQEGVDAVVTWLRKIGFLR